MPSVLVETGFITNPSEEKYLNSKEGRIILHLQYSGPAETILMRLTARAVFPGKEP